MKLICSTWVFSALILAALASVPVASQPNLVGLDPQLAPMMQKPRIGFAPAVAYNSGGPATFSVMAADLRGNGKLDLVVANYCESAEEYSCPNPLGEVAVLLGNGDGTFQSAVTYSTGAYLAYSVAVGDINGDGIPDLVVTNLLLDLAESICGSVSAVSVLIGNGDGTFQPAVNYATGGHCTYSVALADLRGNGNLT